MMKTLRNDKFYPTLFTNTGLSTSTNSPWWEGLSDAIPEPMIDWQGKPYVAGSGTNVAHPNSRFTVSIFNCPTLSPEADNPKGVPISAILFGGRRSNTVPLVCESFDWEHGVFRASANGSETTAAATGAAGVVRRDPMAMLPFCGYNMGDYFSHWLSVGQKLAQPPKIFFVNWFMKDDQGRFMWPGFRDNSRVIKWMVDRVKGKVPARETAVGLMPRLEDFDMTDLSLPDGTMDKLFELNPTEWKKEVAEIETFYSQFGNRLPKALAERLSELKSRFEK
jgi:phosphoenolpyruvate carboxykinase (GTP)